jgi:hypothetical protein
MDNLQYFVGFSRRNLLMMLTCCLLLNHSDIGIPAEHHNPLVQILRAKLFGPEYLNSDQHNPIRVPLITTFTSPVFYLLELKQVFREEDLSLSAPDLLPSHPLICFKYQDTLGKAWFDYGAAARNLAQST